MTLKEITQQPDLDTMEVSLSQFEVNLNSHLSLVEELGRYYEVCALNNTDNTHQVGKTFCDFGNRKIIVVIFHFEALK